MLVCKAHQTVAVKHHMISLNCSSKDKAELFTGELIYTVKAGT